MADATVRRVIEIDVKQGKEALAALRAMQQNLKSLEDTASSAGKSLGGLTSVFGKFGGAAGGLAGIGAVISGLKSSVSVLTEIPNALISINRAVLETQSTLERLRLGFTTLNPSGGIAAAGQELEYVRKISVDLGVDFNKAAEAYLKLGAASKGTLLEGRQTRDVFEAISVASRNLGLSTLQSENAFRAIQQVISKGVLQQEELRGQLSEALPGAFQIAARAMGVTQTELNKLIKEGQVFAEDFVPKFAAQVKKEFGQELPAGVNDATLALNRVKSAFEQLQQAFTDSGPAKLAAEQTTELAISFELASKNIRKATADGEGFFGAMLAGFKGLLDASEKQQEKLFGLNFENDPVRELQLIQKELKAAQAAKKDLVSTPDVSIVRLNRSDSRIADLLAKEASAQEKVNQKKREETDIQSELNRLKNRSDAPAERLKAEEAATIRAGRAYFDLTKQFKDNAAERKRLLTQLEIAKDDPGIKGVPGEYERIKKAIIEATEARGKDVSASEQEKKATDQFIESLTKQLSVQKQIANGAPEEKKVLAQKVELEQRISEVKGKANREALISARIIVDELAVQTEYAKAYREREAAQKSLAAATDNTLSSVQADISATDEQITTLLRGKEATEELTISKLEYKKAQIDTTLQTVVESDEQAKAQKTLEELSKAYGKLIERKGLLADKNYEESLRKFREKYAEEEEALARGLRDEISSAIFDGIKNQQLDIGQLIKDTLRREIEEKIFKIAVQPVIDPFVKAMQEAIDTISNYLSRSLRDAFQQAQYNSSSGGLGGALGGFFSSLFGGGGTAVDGGNYNILGPDGRLAYGGVFGPGGRAQLSAFAMGGVMTPYGRLTPNTYSGGGIADRPQLALFGEGRNREAYIPLPDNKNVPVTIRVENGRARAFVPLPSGRSIPVALTGDGDMFGGGATMGLPDGSSVSAGPAGTDGGAPAAFARGGVMSSSGPVPMFAYADGGVGGRPYVPVSSMGDNNPGWTANAGNTAPVNIVIENHGAQVTERREKTADGRDQIRFIIDATKAELSSDVQNGGSFSKTLEGRYPSMSRGSGTARLG